MKRSRGLRSQTRHTLSRSVREWGLSPITRPPPTFAEFPLKVQLVAVGLADKFDIAPPEPPELPLNVLLMITGLPPTLAIPPPKALAELPLNLQFLTVGQAQAHIMASDGESRRQPALQCFAVDPAQVLKSKLPNLQLEVSAHAQGARSEEHTSELQSH